MVFRIDLHNHPRAAADSFASTRALAKYAARQGITHLGITEHDVLATYPSEIYGVKIIAGTEFTLDDGSHLIGLPLMSPVNGRTLDSVISEVKSQRGLVIVPHPYRQGTGLLRDGGAYSARVQDIMDRVDAIEVFNGWQSEELNKKAIEIANRYHKPVVAGSDSHYAVDAGMCFLELVSDKDSIPDLVLKGTSRRIHWLSRDLSNLHQKDDQVRNFQPRLRKRIPPSVRSGLKLILFCAVRISLFVKLRKRSYCVHEF